MSMASEHGDTQSQGEKSAGREISVNYQSSEITHSVAETEIYFDASQLDKGMSPKRVAELDSLRGLAALVIVLYHLRPDALPFGWTSVDLFFFLSGYLITKIIIENGSTPGFFPRFYARRCLRVWPIYFLTVGLLAACSTLLYTRCVWSELPCTLTFTQNLSWYWWRPARSFSIYLTHTWTLAIEEQFYIIWPSMVILVGRKRVILLSLVCLLGSVVMRSRGFFVVLLISRADGLALGGMLAGILDICKP